MADTVGVLKVHIDAEPGQALEHLARLERDRDEAREAARYGFKYMKNGWPEGAAKLAEKHPWIRE